MFFFFFNILRLWDFLDRYDIDRPTLTITHAFIRQEIFLYNFSNVNFPIKLRLIRFGNPIVENKRSNRIFWNRRFRPFSFPWRHEMDRTKWKQKETTWQLSKEKNKHQPRLPRGIFWQLKKKMRLLFSGIREARIKVKDWDKKVHCSHP